MAPQAKTFLSQYRRLVLISSGALVFIFLVVAFWQPSTRLKIETIIHPHEESSFPPPLPLIDNSEHPIEQLMREADEKTERLKEAETHSLAEAAAAYRTRRGRHPPPGFEIWHKYAVDNNATIIEEFYDQLYESLEPFWSLEPLFLRQFPSTYPQTITVRDGVATRRSLAPDWGVNYMVGVVNELPSIPDVDFAWKFGDYPRNLVPFKRMQEYMDNATALKKQHNAVPLEQMNNTWPRYRRMNDDIPKTEPEERKRYWGNTTSFWDVLVTACRPDDPAILHQESVPKSDIPPVFSTNYTAGTLKGYVSNYTTARNPCHNPNLRTLHGTFIHALVDNIYTELVPIFAVNKIVGVTNDIVMPPVTHFDGGVYSGVDHTLPWNKKKDMAFWRGGATGGTHSKDNWWGFHRHRLLQLMNGTTQSRVEAELKASGLENPSVQALNSSDPEHFELGLHNFPFPLPHLYAIAAQTYNKLGQWTETFSDGAFTNSFCSKLEYVASILGGGPKTCNHTDEYYSIAEEVDSMVMLNYKYLPDIDGHSSSGRFVKFLRSLSVPIKASIFGEWHDHRLIPWRHFVPMSVENQEWFGIMQFFRGYEGSKSDIVRTELSIAGHDELAEKIGRQGSEWSHHVERKENMLLYLHRALLEYARISSDDRIHMGYVDDLLNKL